MYSNFESRISYKFKNKRLLEEALAHKSYSVEQGLFFYNERLEFLGDSVLGLCAAEKLFIEYPSKTEGELSKIKSILVSKKSLSSFAKKINLQKHIKMGAGENHETIASRDGILSNCLEALIGAIYLDGGKDAAFAFINNFLKETDYTDEDYKSKLQELAQRQYKTLPVYSVISTHGPEHEKIFVVNISVKEKPIATGRGKSKKEAEQNAAKEALFFLSKHD